MVSTLGDFVLSPAGAGLIVIGAAIKIFWKKFEKFGREAKFFNFFPARPLGHARHTKVRVGKFPTGLFVLNWLGSASATPIWGPKAARQARRSLMD